MCRRAPRPDTAGCRPASRVVQPLDRSVFAFVSVSKRRGPGACPGRNRGSRSFQRLVFAAPPNWPKACPSGSPVLQPARRGNAELPQLQPHGSELPGNCEGLFLLPQRLRSLSFLRPTRPARPRGHCFAMSSVARGTRVREPRGRMSRARTTGANQPAQGGSEHRRRRAPSRRRRPLEPLDAPRPSGVLSRGRRERWSACAPSRRPRGCGSPGSSRRGTGRASGSSSRSSWARRWAASGRARSSPGVLRADPPRRLREREAGALRLLHVAVGHRFERFVPQQRSVTTVLGERVSATKTATFSRRRNTVKPTRAWSSSLPPLASR